MAYAVPRHALRRAEQDVIAHMDVRGVDKQKRIVVDADALAGKVVSLGAPLSEGVRRNRHILSIPD